MQLFEATLSTEHQPLAERLRPQNANELIGQRHLLEEGGLLHRLFNAQTLPSMILWGPPGVGKTTIARLLTTQTRSAFEALSAVQAGVADLKKVVQK